MATVRVRDVMSEAVMFLDATQSQTEAWNLLRTHGVSGAPVLNHGGLVGVITRADLADPRRRAPATTGTVADAMTRVVYAVKASDPVMVAVRLMLDEEIGRAVVINDDGSLAGIISLTDILRALSHGMDLRDSSVSGCAVDFVDLRTLRASVHPSPRHQRTGS
jgi:predicted transcriptional regulator